MLVQKRLGFWHDPVPKIMRELMSAVDLILSMLQNVLTR